MYRGFEKKEGERKDGPRKEADRKDGNPIEMLERQLAELRVRTAEVEAQLKKVREGAGGERPNPMPPRGPMGPSGFGGPGASQEEILRRLDKLTQEIDEIRRSIKK